MYGKIKCAFLESNNLDLMSKLNLANPFHFFFEKLQGPLLHHFNDIYIILWKIPEGIVLKTCLIPSNSRVCPAFGPP